MAGILLNRSRQVPAEETPAFGGIAERFRRGGDLDRAIALCRDGLKRFPEQLSARVTLGWALLDKGQYDAARSELEQVLRKAPDNLAAIRGLAELHDRTEGSLPPEDERSWRTEETPVEADAPPAPEPVRPVVNRLAPIPVSFGQHTAEVLHTAAHAEQAAEAAASRFEAAAGLDISPVELEDPATAAMAATEPAPFFVVEPGAATGFVAAELAQFEVTGAAPLDVELETPGAAALSAAVSGVASKPHADALSPLDPFDSADIEALSALVVEPDSGDSAPAPTAFGSSPASVPPPVDVDTAEIDWAGLAALAGDTPIATSAGWDAGDLVRADEPSLAASAFDAVVPAGPAVEELLASIEGLEALDLSPGGLHPDEPAALFASPESLDDIDEAAGQELADAIKALEAATKRVEARLAPSLLRTEPAAAPEAIASFDFALNQDHVSDVTDVVAPPVLDTRHDGAFELVAPALADVSFGFDTLDESVGLADADDAAQAEASLAGVEPGTFDFGMVASHEGADATEVVEAGFASASVEAVDIETETGTTEWARVDETNTPIELEATSDHYGERLDALDSHAAFAVPEPVSDALGASLEEAFVGDAVSESADAVAAPEVEEEAAPPVAERVEADRGEDSNAHADAVTAFGESGATAVAVDSGADSCGQASDIAGSDEAHLPDHEPGACTAVYGAAAEEEETDALAGSDDAGDAAAVLSIALSGEGDEIARFETGGSIARHEVDVEAAPAEAAVAQVEAAPTAAAIADIEAVVVGASDDDAAVDVDVVSGDAVAVPSPGADTPDLADTADGVDAQDLPLAAMVATELEPTRIPATPLNDDGAGGATRGDDPVEAEVHRHDQPSWSGSDTSPVVYVYDSPVLSASDRADMVAGEIAALVSTGAPAAGRMAGQGQPVVRSPLAALERFLRKVQARQLELRGETVA